MAMAMSISALINDFVQNTWVIKLKWEGQTRAVSGGMWFRTDETHDRRDLHLATGGVTERA